MRALASFELRIFSLLRLNGTRVDLETVRSKGFDLNLRLLSKALLSRDVNHAHEIYHQSLNSHVLMCRMYINRSAPQLCIYLDQTCQMLHKASFHAFIIMLCVILHLVSYGSCITMTN